MSEDARPGRKGIILAGGEGTRLDPLTRAIAKPLLPVYDKPMVFYPLTTLLSAGIRDILLISTPRDIDRFELLLGDGSEFGATLSYAVQPRPEGIAQALILARDFLDGGPSALILGDNIFWGDSLSPALEQAMARATGATILVRRVPDPERYGVALLDDGGRALDIIEKPSPAPSPYAVTGLYFFDHRAPDVAAGLTPSDRGELEITDVNRWYLEAGSLEVIRFEEDLTWMDMGTPASLFEAARFVEAHQTTDHPIGDPRFPLAGPR